MSTGSRWNVAIDAARPWLTSVASVSLAGGDLRGCAAKGRDRLAASTSERVACFVADPCESPGPAPLGNAAGTELSGCHSAQFHRYTRIADGMAAH